MKPDVPHQGLVSEPVIKNIRSILAGRAFWGPLPSAVRVLFAQRRQDEFARIARMGWPLLLMLVALVGGGGWWLFGAEMHGGDKALWWASIGLEVLLLMIVVPLVQQPRVLPHYQAVIVLGGALNLAIPLLASMLLANPRLAQINSYVVMLIITIQVLVLRLSLWASALCGLVGVGLAVLAAMVVWGVQPDWPLLLWFFGGGLLVNLFVAALLEYQDRISFLQSLLLVHESSERERLNEELDRLAHQDALSGLANRRHFDVLLEREWERLRREARPLALLFIDIDYFKNYNDTYGHGAGDECLMAIGGVLKNVARRPGDVAARYGGEEFVVLLPGTELAGARELGERIIQDIDALAISHAASLVAEMVTASVGLAVLVPQEKFSMTDLLAQADAALYAAKHAGRHRLMMAPEAFDEKFLKIKPA